MVAGGLSHAVFSGVQASIFWMVRHVTRQKLLGQYLNRRTGTLIRSITASPEFNVTDTEVVGVFGSNLDYARYHEEGFSGILPVAEFYRRPAFTEMDAEAGSKRSDTFFTARSIRVRAHTRRVEHHARYFLRDTVSEGTPQAGINVRKAIILLANTGRVPRYSGIRKAAPLTLRDLGRF